jgi:hypothetical protein
MRMVTTPCARCQIRAARMQLWHWHPELCGPCAEDLKHPSQRGCEWGRRRDDEESA